MKIILCKSSRKSKKWSIEIDGRLIHFGAVGYEDYTMHHDKERKRRYLARAGGHKKKDIKTAGFWAEWLLWNKHTITASARDIERRFNVKIKLCIL